MGCDTILFMNFCPICNKELVNIIYGKPTQKLIDMAKTDDIALGGNKPLWDAPSYYCYECNETF